MYNVFETSSENRKISYKTHLNFQDRFLSIFFAFIRDKPSLSSTYSPCSWLLADALPLLQQSFRRSLFVFMSLVFRLVYYLTIWHIYFLAFFICIYVISHYCSFCADQLSSCNKNDTEPEIASKKFNKRHTRPLRTTFCLLHSKRRGTSNRDKKRRRAKTAPLTPLLSLPVKGTY